MKERTKDGTEVGEEELALLSLADAVTMSWNLLLSRPSKKMWIAVTVNSHRITFVASLDSRVFAR